MKVNTAICVGAPTSASSGPIAAEAHGVAEAGGDAVAHSWNSARVHSKRWSRWRSVPAGRLSKRTLYSTFGVVSDDRPRPGELEQHPLEGGEPRRVEMLDDLDHGRGVEARQPLVAVGQGALEQLDALALLRRELLQAQAVGGQFQRCVDTSTPAISANCRSARRAEELPLAAAEVEHPLRADAFSAARTVPRRCSFRLMPLLEGLLFPTVGLGLLVRVELVLVRRAAPGSGA